MADAHTHIHIAYWCS